MATVTVFEVSVLATEQLVELLGQVNAELKARNWSPPSQPPKISFHDQMRQKLEAEELQRKEKLAEERRKAEEKQLQTDQSLRDFAKEARSLFGSDIEEFPIKVWSSGADRRVYCGFDWACYYHTGNSRVSPGTLKCEISLDYLAKERGITTGEAETLVKDFCQRLAKAWNTLKLQVSEDNAPRDPACYRTNWLIRSGTRLVVRKDGEFTLGKNYTPFKSRQEAETQMADLTFPDMRVESKGVWDAFAPKS